MILSKNDFNAILLFSSKVFQSGLFVFDKDGISSSLDFESE